MNNLAEIRLKLGINAQRFIQQVQLNHGTIGQKLEPKSEQ